MKKKLILGVMTCLLLTGCGNDGNGTLTCTKSSTDDDGLKTDETIEVTYENNKVTNVVGTTIQENDEESIDMVYEFSKLFIESFNEINGINAEVEKDSDTSIKTTISVDYENLDVDKLNELMEDADTEDAVLSSDTDITIDEFKKNNLKDYTCE